MGQPTSLAPNRALLLLEGRAIPELFGFAASLPTLPALAPRGDGQPVLVLPGLTTSDRATVALRRFLTSKGYPTHGWNMGLNLGPRPGAERGVIDLVKTLSDDYDRKVSIVGWSLGGIYARELSKMQPDLVRQVSSLGSPFAVMQDGRIENVLRVKITNRTKEPRTYRFEVPGSTEAQIISTQPTYTLDAGATMTEPIRVVLPYDAFTGGRLTATLSVIDDQDAAFDHTLTLQGPTARPAPAPGSSGPGSSNQANPVSSTTAETSVTDE